MDEKTQDQVFDEDQKELTVDELENVVGGTSAPSTAPSPEDSAGVPFNPNAMSTVEAIAIASGGTAGAGLAPNE